MPPPHEKEYELQLLEGESTVLTSKAFAFYRPGHGQRPTNDMVVVLPVDKNTSKLQNAAVKGKAYTSAVIEGKGFRVKMNNVYISGVQMYKPGGGKDPILEVTLNFETIDMPEFAQQEESVEPGYWRGGWDLKEAK
jgi:type VI protein secretion system component Hcp